MRQPILNQVHRFLEWSNRKIKIHFAERGEIYFSERDIWWVGLGENVGAEINGKHFPFERPAVVVKKFSRDMLLIVPCTTKPKNGSWYYCFRSDGKECRAIMSQLRAISSKRLMRKMGAMSPEEFVCLRQTIVDLIKTDPSTLAVRSSEPLARSI